VELDIGFEGADDLAADDLTVIAAVVKFNAFADDDPRFDEGFHRDYCDGGGCCRSTPLPPEKPNCLLCLSAS